MSLYLEEHWENRFTLKEKRAKQVLYAELKNISPTRPRFPSWCEETGQCPGGNARPYVGFCQAFCRTAKEEASMSWIRPHSDRVGKGAPSLLR